MTDWKLRPARDLGLPLAARFRSHHREVALAGVLAGLLWRGLLKSYLAVAHQLVVTGRENLPDAAPFVLVANHASHLDALSLAAALPARLAHRATALAAGEVFFNSVATAAFAATALNAMPIWRKRTSVNDLAFLRQRLVEDELVFLLFPEGTRTKTGEMGRFKPGLGVLTAGSNVLVVPCNLEGAFRCWPPTRRLPRPGKLHLRIGPAMSFADTPNDRNGWMHVAATTEQAVRSLAAAKPVALTD